MLSAIRRALALVAVRHRKPFALTDVPPEDPAVYEMIGHGDTVGVFQIESRAQMAMLPRLKPRNFYDLVIEVAIVRPGPIQGGMVHPYLRRRQGIEPVTYPSDAVKAVLERTLGVPIFQEQVMQLAVVAAGFTPGESDQLRRSMAAWKRKGGLEPFEKRLVEGMRERGYEESFARQIYQQILGFGEYGFPESHAASFALLVYVSSWLKHYEPAAFTCALLNSQPMGFYSPSQLVQDLRRHDVEVRSPDVGVSEWECTLEETESVVPAQAGTQVRNLSAFTIENWAPAYLATSAGTTARSQPALRLGLCLVKGLSEAGGKRVAIARKWAPFASVEDLVRRAQLNQRDSEALAAAGALARLSGHRRRAVWDVAGVERLPEVLDRSTIVETPAVLAPPSEGEDIVADYASLGLSLGRHPLALLRSRLERQRMATAADLKSWPHGQLARVTGLVTGRQRPGTASGVTFVTLEDETGMVNVIVWNDLAERQRKELLRSSLLTVYGTLEREGEVVHVIASRLRDQTPLLGRLVTRSRDFH
jgi:error-prone DNA polymerase